MPKWWIEGIATYSENARGNSNLFALKYEAPIYEEKFFSLAKATYNSPVFPYDRSYIAGYFIVSKLAQEFGEDKIGEINANYTSFPLKSLNSSFKKSIDLKATDLYLKAINQVKEQFKDFDSYSSLNKPYKGQYFLPYPTQQGVIGLVSTEKQGTLIYNYSLEKPLATFLPIYDNFSFYLAPNGKNAYFSLYSDNYSDIYKLNLQTNKSKRLTYKQKLFHPVVNSAEDKLVAIELNKHKFNLVEIDLKENLKKTLYANKQSSVYHPAISLDDQNIVAIEEQNGLSKLILIDFEGNKKDLFAFSRVELLNPRFVDNNTIWFSADWQNKFALYSYSLESGKIKHLLDENIGVLGAIKDKEALLYQSYSSEGFNLKEASLKELIAVDFTLKESEVKQIDKEITYSLKKYYDIPRYTFWLPLSLEEDSSFNLGATLFLQSYLEKQNLLLSAGWDFVEKSPFITSTYNYTVKSFNFGLTTSFAFKNQSTDYTWNVGSTFHTSLYQKEKVKSKIFVNSFSEAKFNSPNELILLQSFSFDYLSNYGVRDYWGRFRYNVGLSFQYNHLFNSNENSYFPLLRLYGQLPVGLTGQTTSLQIDSAYFGNSGYHFAPFSSSAAEAQSLITFAYKIPFHNVDWPIYYGGITSLRAMLETQTLLNYDNNEVAWDKVFFITATLEGDINIGSNSAITPFVSFGIRSDNFAYTYKFGLKYSSLFNNLSLRIIE